MKWKKKGKARKRIEASSTSTFRAVETPFRKRANFSHSRWNYFFYYTKKKGTRQSSGRPDESGMGEGRNYFLYGPKKRILFMCAGGVGGCASQSGKFLAGRTVNNEREKLVYYRRKTRAMKTIYISPAFRRDEGVVEDKGHPVLPEPVPDGAISDATGCLRRPTTKRSFSKQYVYICGSHMSHKKKRRKIRWKKRKLRLWTNRLDFVFNCRHKTRTLCGWEIREKITYYEKSVS